MARKSEEALRKQSERMKGKKLSVETRKKISIANAGKKRTKKQRKRISEAHKGQTPWNKGLTKNTHPSVKKTSEKLKGNKIGLGRKVSQKTRRKIANTLKTKWKTEEHYMKGWNPSEEIRRKIGVKHKGKTLSNETKLKLRKANLGKKQTVETKKKISQSNTGQKRTKEQREQMSKTQRRLIKEGRKKFPYFSEESREKLRKKRLNEKFPKKDTKFEKSVQNALKKKGVKFETHKAIPGQPDIFIKPNICIFADGDFFHANPSKYPDDFIIWKGRYSKTQKKILTAVTSKMIRQKDKKVREKLRGMGYMVIQFWETEWKKDQEKYLQKILKAVK